uniref:Uncharacterized protein n=1 Tax=Timema tahoe TaxID=61484 RepID=A0A7R9IKL4_9NEOP|nr:unnamed protein product [Timema tahoe]
MVGATEEVYGRTSDKRSWEETPWWNNRVMEAVEEKNKISIKPTHLLFLAVWTRRRQRIRWMDQPQKVMEAKRADWRCVDKGKVWKDRQERKRMCQTTCRGGGLTRLMDGDDVRLLPLVRKVEQCQDGVENPEELIQILQFGIREYQKRDRYTQKSQMRYSMRTASIKPVAHQAALLRRVEHCIRCPPEIHP